jgi:hypothetical protein
MGFGVTGLQLSLGSKFLFRFDPLRCTCVDPTKLAVKSGYVRTML